MLDLFNAEYERLLALEKEEKDDRPPRKRTKMISQKS